MFLRFFKERGFFFKKKKKSPNNVIIYIYIYILFFSFSFLFSSNVRKKAGGTLQNCRVSRHILIFFFLYIQITENPYPPPGYAGKNRWTQLISYVEI